MDNTTLGDTVRTFRLNMNLTQQNLGDAIGLDPTIISRIETNRRPVSSGEVEDIAKALSLSAEQRIELFRAAGWVIDPGQTGPPDAQVIAPAEAPGSPEAQVGAPAEAPGLPEAQVGVPVEAPGLSDAQPVAPAEKPCRRMNLMLAVLLGLFFLVIGAIGGYWGGELLEPLPDVKSTLLSRDWWYWPWPGENWMSVIVFEEEQQGLRVHIKTYKGFKEQVVSGRVTFDYETVVMEGTGRALIHDNCFALRDLEVTQNEFEYVDGGEGKKVQGSKVIDSHPLTINSKDICPISAYSGRLQFGPEGEGDVLITAHKPDIFNPSLPGSEGQEAP